MHIEISYRDIDKTDALDEHIRGAVEGHLGRFGERVTRYEVHVGDVNASKPGPDDKRCMIEARPKGSQPVVAEAKGTDMYTVITEAAHKLERVLEKKFGKAEAS